MPSVNIVYRYIDTPDRVTPLLNTFMYSVTLQCHNIGINFLQVFPVNLIRERNIFNESSWLILPTSIELYYKLIHTIDFFFHFASTCICKCSMTSCTDVDKQLIGSNLILSSETICYQLPVHVIVHYKWCQYKHQYINQNKYCSLAFLSKEESTNNKYGNNAFYKSIFSD